MIEKTSILIVDDMPTNLLLLGNILEKAGFAIQVASNGQEALECASTSPTPKLVLLDILMPQMDGYETCRKLKDDPRTSPIPVIFVTALGMVTDKLKGFQAGAVDFITKPYDADEVLARVRTHLSLARMEELTTEIEERKRSEQALRESEDLLKMSQRIGHLGAWKWHLPSDRLTCSEETLRIFGLPEDTIELEFAELVGTSIHPEDRQRLESDASAVGSAKIPKADRYRVVHPDGSVRHVWLEPGKLETAADGSPLTLQGIAKDITESHLAQLKRQELEASLANSRKLEALGLMAGGIAHDFNNMLGVIVGHGELARRRAGADPATERDLEAILKASRRCAELIRQLLTFASKDAVKPRSLAADATIAQALEPLRSALPENTRIVWQPGAPELRIRMDPAQLGHILSSLVANAADACAAGGTIRVATSCQVSRNGDAPEGSDPPTGNRLCILVEDQGQGIAPDIMEKIFDPFFTTKPRGKGVGLGLSTVLGAVRQNGGHIDVESSPGKGTRARIVLPCCEPVATESRPTRGAPPAAPEGETILVVEDHPDVLQMTTLVLKNLGFRILSTTNPWQALDLVRERKGEIHLLLTDVVMPGMDGRELVALARREAPDLRCLFCSGFLAESPTGCSDSAIPSDLIQKPYSIQDLHRKIREILDRE